MNAKVAERAANIPAVLVVGHSHLRALQNAVHERRPDAQFEPAPRFLQLRQPGFEPDLTQAAANRAFWPPAAWAMLADPEPDCIVSCIAGQSHTVLGLVEHVQRFDFVLDAAPELALDETREVLPGALVRALMARQMQPDLLTMRALRHFSPRPVVHLNAPPPIPSAKHILQYPNNFRERLKTFSVTPALIRYKLWRLQSALTEQVCRELGFDFLPVPPQTQDEAGCLVPRAWNPDPSHGNAWYGEQVWAQLAQHLQTSARNAASTPSA